MFEFALFLVAVLAATPVFAQNQPGPSCAPGEMIGFPQPPAPDSKDVWIAGMDCASIRMNKPVYNGTTTVQSYRLVEHVINVLITETTVIAKVSQYVISRVGQCIIEEPVPAEIKTEIVWVDVTSTVANYTTVLVTSTTEILAPVVQNLPCTSNYPQIGASPPVTVSPSNTAALAQPAQTPITAQEPPVVPPDVDSDK